MGPLNFLYYLLILLITIHHTQSRRTRTRNNELIRPINDGEKIDVPDFLSSFTKSSKRNKMKHNMRHKKLIEKYENNYDFMLLEHRRRDDDGDEFIYDLEDNAELRNPLF